MNTKRDSTISDLEVQFFKVGRVAIVLLACCGAHVSAACDMTTADNTWHAGLDINDPSGETKHIIKGMERIHFTEEVESLSGGSTGPIPQDLEYTLNSVPNHYRALASYANWDIKNPQLAQERRRTAECYLKRAIGFRPQDSQLRMLFGTFLHRTGRLAEAKAEYESAGSMGYDSAELFYDLGLLELDLGNVDAARKHAERAYAMGYPLPGLRNKLARIKNSKPSRP